MKKSLIALAVVGAFSAPAFADTTTLYGVIDAAVANVNGTNYRSQTTVVSGGLATSRFGVKGSEDLGDGLKAIYNLEYALDIASNTGIGSNGTGATTMNIGSGTYARQQLIGLSADSWGTVAAGRLQTTGKYWGDSFDPFSGSDVSPLNNLTSAKFLVGSTAAYARASRALAYISPDISGFKAELDYVPSAGGTTVANGNLGNVANPSSAADANSTIALVSASYDQAPFSAKFVYASNSAPTNATTAASASDRKEWALGGSYDFGVAKLFGTYQASHNDAPGAMGNTDKAYSVSGLIPAGWANVALSYAKVKNDTDTTGNSDATSYSLAALHNLSKTTTLYAAYAHVSNSSAGTYSVLNGAIGVAPASPSSTSGVLALGVSKKF